MFANLVTLGRLTGHEVEATILIESLKARVSTIEDKLGDVPDRPKVFYELDATDPNAPYTAGAGTFIDTLITMAGGDNIASDLGSEYPSISAEELLLRNPEIILLGDAAYGISPETVIARPGWEAIDAVKNKRIYSFDDNLASRPGPRLVDGLEALAILLHPDLFQ
jgi:iron complex transport system substrate-binding protein